MCFSPESSFAVAAVLIPVGGWCLWKARRQASEWMLLAAFPLAFAVQQLIEGFVWIAIDAGNADGTLNAGRGFLFFSHFFWPAYAPLAVMCSEPDPDRRRVIGFMAVIGAVFGASIMVPAVLFPGWLEVGVTDGSIDYRTRLVYDGVVGRDALKVIYAAIILSAFFVSTRSGLRLYGMAILASVIFAAVFYPGVFISVWCFFAAILSLCVVLVLMGETGRNPTSPPVQQ